MTDQDRRVQCIACAHYAADRYGGWCRNALAAKLSLRQPETPVGRAFAVLKQDCNGFKSKQKQN